MARSVTVKLTHCGHYVEDGREVPRSVPPGEELGACAAFGREDHGEERALHVKARSRVFLVFFLLAAVEEALDVLGDLVYGSGSIDA